MNLFDSCSGRSLRAGLSWINEPDHWEFDANRTLVVTAPPAADFFIDPSGDTVKSSAPFLYAVVKGDFSAVTRVSVDMKQQYDSGCLMIMVDDTHWAKLCFEFFDGHPSILSVVTKESSDDCISAKAETSQPYLRAARSGNCFAFHYSLDGEQWKLVRYFRLDSSENIQVGVVAQSPVGDGAEARFDQLELALGNSGDIRTVNP